MFVTRTQRTVVAWIACLAALLATLAPSIAQALQRGEPGAWIEVCTVLGSKLVAVDGTTDDSAPKGPAKHPLQHCSYCSLHVTALGLPPASLSLPPLVPLGLAAAPELMLQAPRTLFAWAIAQPRAPPALS